MSTKQKVTQAFRELRRAGYFARQNFWCCQTCGCAAVPDEYADKYVFYHHQDNRAWNKNGELKYGLYLAWEGDAKFIVDTFRKQGLNAVHDGAEFTRILILPKEE